MARDLPEYLWAAYNFWCDTDFDENCGLPNKWTKKGLHHRSSQHFDLMVNSTDFSFPGPTPWVYDVIRRSQWYFTIHCDNLWAVVSRNNTFITTDELLSANPQQVWDGLVKALNSNLLQSHHPKLEQFASMKYNTQSSKGENASISVKEFIPGVYEISGYQRVSSFARATLNKMWHDDCKSISWITGYQYDACIVSDQEIPTLVLSTEHKAVMKELLDKAHLKLTGSGG